MDIREALEAAGGDRKRAAAILGVSLRTLYRRLTEAGISIPSNGDLSAAVLTHIRSAESVHGWIDLARLTTSLYGADSRGGRQRVWSLLQGLRRRGTIDRDSTGRWYVVR